MPQFLPPLSRDSTRVMMFVDGENLAIRYKAELGTRTPAEHVVHFPDVMVWSRYASRVDGPQEYIRRYYYTSARGDDGTRNEIEEALRVMGVEAPRVFPRQQSGRSKRVDITLTTEMLSHAHRDNYDIAILVSGDGDYVPLVDAVKSEGKRVVLWALESGLNSGLRKAADHYWNIGDLLFRPESDATKAIYG
jgi:uncharacterized LabA/DUF88 family protein